MKLKKVLAGMLASIITAASVIVPAEIPVLSNLYNAMQTAFAEDFIPGDVNGSGRLDLQDVIAVTKYIDGRGAFTESERLRADFNQNGQVDLYDVISISRLVIDEEVAFTGTTSAYGGITIESVTAETGTVNLKMPVYVDMGIPSNGCIVKYILPDGFTCKPSASSYLAKNDDGVILYASSASYSSEQPLDTLQITLPEDTEEGEYVVTAEILALSDGNGGYYTNPKVTSGVITVKDPAPSDPSYNPSGTDKAGVGVGRAAVEYGTTEVSVPLYMINTKSKGCILSVDVDSPLSVKGFSNHLESYDNTAIYVSAVPYKPGETFGEVIIDIKKNTAPGIYLINLTVKQLADDGSDYITDFTAVSGYVLIEPPASTGTTTTETTAATNVTTMTTTTIINTGDTLTGDANGSGELDMHDAIIMAGYLRPGHNPTDEQKKLFDYNGDGKFSLHDIIAVSRFIINQDIDVTGTTPTDGRITIGNAAAVQGSSDSMFSVYAEGLATKGLIIRYILPECISIGQGGAVAYNENTGIAMYVSGTEYSSYDAIGNHRITVADNAEPGQYTIKAEILALDDANDGYYANPAISFGVITVEEAEPPYNPDDEPSAPPVYSSGKGIGIDSVTVPYGRRQIELGLYFPEYASSKGCILSVGTESPLSVEGFKGKYCEASEGSSAVYINSNIFEQGAEFGRVVINIKKNTAPGKYPVTLTFNQIAGLDGVDIEPPPTVTGCITILEPGYSFDTDRMGMGLESVNVKYGTKQAVLRLYMLNTSSQGSIISINADAPLSVEKIDGCMSYSTETQEAVFVTGDKFNAGQCIGSVIINIDSNAKPGKYLVNLNIRQLAGLNHTDIINPAAISGYITILEDETEPEPTESPADPAKGIPVPAGAEVSMYGDVNNDRTVNVADVVGINLFILNSKKNTLTAECTANADCVKDGFINSSDSIRIMNYVVEIISIEYLGV